MTDFWIIKSYNDIYNKYGDNNNNYLTVENSNNYNDSDVATVK